MTVRPRNLRAELLVLSGSGFVAAVACFVVSSLVTGAWRWAFSGLGLLVLIAVLRRIKTVESRIEAERPPIPGGSWMVTLQQCGPRPISVIKELRQYLRIDLDTAKNLVGSVPSVVACDVGEEFARSLADALRGADADVRLTDAPAESSH